MTKGILIQTDLSAVDPAPVKPEPTSAVVFVGFAKIAEEAGELIGQLMRLYPFPIDDHPNGRGKVIKHVLDEMADIQAAMDYFYEVNEILPDRKRYARKLAFFHEVGLSGIPFIEQVEHGEHNVE